MVSPFADKEMEGSGAEAAQLEELPPGWAVIGVPVGPGAGSPSGPCAGSSAAGWVRAQLCLTQSRGGSLNLHMAFYSD